MHNTMLPILDVDLRELEHIKTKVARCKLGDVLRGLRSGVELPPIWLSKADPNARWNLEDGNHRLHASRLLGHVSIRAIVAVGPEQIAIGERMWLEGRIGLDPLDAAAYQRQLERTREALARCGLDWQPFQELKPEGRSK